MINQIKNFILEGEKEFEEKFNSYEEPEKYLTNRDIENGKLKAHLDWHKQRQISLIKMIVDMVESEKIQNPQSTFASPIDEYLWHENNGVNKGLDTISSKLKILIKE